jgi:HAD superfamily hydrolase (TIGR01549 family)
MDRKETGRSPDRSSVETRAAVGVLFDIDGTLVDTNYLHTMAWRRAFVDHGLDVPSARIHRMIGAGSDVLLRELAGVERADVKAAWRRHFDSLEPEIRAFPGAADLLRAVAGHGAVVALASSSEEDDLDAALHALGGDDAIHVVTSAGDVEQAKPSSEVFEVAMARAGLTSQGTFVVGDSVWDIEAARRTGLECICVLTGGTSPLDLLAAGAAAVYPDVAFVLEHLDDTPLGRLLGRAGGASGAGSDRASSRPIRT